MPVLREILAVGLALVLLLFWREFSTLHCVVGILPVMIISVIALNRRDYAVRRRRCLVACVLERDTGAYQYLSGHWLVTLNSIIFAIIAGGILSLQLVLWDKSIWLLLLVNSLFVLLLFHGVGSVLKRVIQPGMHEAVVKHLTSWINTILLLGVLVWIQFNSPFPEYLSAGSLSQSIAGAAASYDSSCAITQALVRLSLEQEVVGLWFMINTTAGLSSQPLQWAVWAIFLAVNAVGLWGFSYYLTQVIAFAGGRGDGE